METTPPKSKKPVQKYATLDQFNELTATLGKIADMVVEIKNKPQPTAAEIKESEEVRKAKHDQAPMNPSWEEKAQEILGEMLDHCEAFYPKGGGQIFTVVIKPEFSNAPKEYMEMRKSDRRSCEIGNEGIGGVEKWCRLVRQNLKRAQAK